MGTELSRQIRELIDGGARPISPGEIAGRAFAPRPRPRARGAVRLGWAAAIAGIAAVVCVGAITAAQLTAAGPPARRDGALLTAAQVHRVTAASTAALARSARAYITYGGPGPYHSFQSEYVRFSGGNYSFAGSVVNPAPGGRPGQVAWFAERVVNGQAYDHELGANGWHWFHYASAAGVHAVHVLDPRTMLDLLAPSERFRFAGHVMVGGLRLERLRASDPAKMPGLGSLLGVQAGRYATALDVLVDSHGVVRRVDISLGGATLVATQPHATPAGANVPPGARVPLPYGLGGYTTVTVTFADIGQPQTITVPAHAIKIRGPSRVAVHPPAILPATVAGNLTRLPSAPSP